jgi:NhaP-type Na+/H+ or K+/H+ antiporter
MGNLGWIIFFGTLLVATSASAGFIRRSPITSFAVYLVAGAVVGPAVLGLAAIAFDKDSTAWLRPATEMGMVVSLFITGLKLRLPFHDPGWRMSLRLAMPGMLLTVGGLSLVGHVAFGWPWPLALALAAILAPTDPVLASLVSVDDARDDDALRVGLSGEAGLNDGTALPFLVLALAWMTGQVDTDGGFWTHWFSVALVWDWAGGLLIGFVIGWGLGHIGTRLRHVAQGVAPSDLLALGLMALAYAVAESLHGSGFLAAFAAGVGLRRVELGVTHGHPSVDEEADRAEVHHERAPAELLVNPNERATAEAEHPAQAVGWVVSDALSFGETMERLIGAAMVFLVGVAVLPYFSPEGALFAAALFFVIRPVAVWLSTIGSGAPWQRRLLFGWFGIRGLGSLNYLAYALTHGLAGAQAGFAAACVLTVVALSIVAHGMSTTPLMNWRGRELARRERLRKDARG